MSNKLKLEESLSALMDSEVDELELRRLLKSLPDDVELQHTWERYHLLSSILKQESHSNPKVDLLTGIRAQLDQEPSLADSAVRSFSSESLGDNMIAKDRPKSIFARFGQGAIAASAALGVLFSANFLLAPAVLGPSLAEIDSAQGGQSLVDIDVNELPTFNGDFTASELIRVVSYDNDSEDDAFRSRLRQAVYRALDDNSNSIELIVPGADTE